MDQSSSRTNEASSAVRPVAAQKDGRRTIGFIGNCQAELLHRAFSRVVSGEEIRSFYHFFDVPEADRAAAAEELAQCDDLLVQDVKNFEDYALRDAIPASTNIMRFPVIWFAAPWPYDDFNGLRDAHARSQDDPSLRTTTYYDGALGKLRKLVPDPQARLEAYRRLDVPGLVRPERILDFEARRLEALDARFGTLIGKTILDGFRESQLFYTVNRPCGSLLSMLLDYVLAASKIDVVRQPMPELDELQVIQSPVHPKIAAALGMTWVTADRTYQVHGQVMDFETYVRAYIARYS
jgi:hypothetical protein